MEIYEKLWESMEIYGHPMEHLWKSIDIENYGKPSTEKLWKTMESHGTLWEFYGNLWKTIDPRATP